VAINDELPLMTARRDATAKLMRFAAPGHQRPAPPYSARISSIYLLSFGKLWLGPIWWPRCATPGNEAERIIYGGWVKTPVLF